MGTSNQVKLDTCVRNLDLSILALDAQNTAIIHKRTTQKNREKESAKAKKKVKTCAKKKNLNPLNLLSLSAFPFQSKGSALLLTLSLFTFTLLFYYKKRKLKRNAFIFAFAFSDRFSLLNNIKRKSLVSLLLSVSLFKAKRHILSVAKYKKA